MRGANRKGISIFVRTLPKGVTDAYVPIRITDTSNYTAKGQNLMRALCQEFL